MKVPNLAVLRGNAGLTQAQLCERAGVCKNTISKLESGERPTAHACTVKKLVDALGVGVDEISGKPGQLVDGHENGRRSSASASAAASAVEKRIELFEIGKGLDERRLSLLLELGRELLRCSETGTSSEHELAKEPNAREDDALQTREEKDNPRQELAGTVQPRGGWL